MDEEADRSEYDHLSSAAGGDERRALEWEIGLPSAQDLTPLSQLLLPPELAAAFSIAPERARTILDVHRASQSTLSSLRRYNSAPSPSSPKSLSPDDQIAAEGDDLREDPKSRRSDREISVDDQSARALKRARLVWTPQLHRRFVDVVAHVGIKNAVPKTVMQMMNVEGLTRENVASHLQKYRLYLKRIQGISDEGPSSSSDPLFASAPIPQSTHERPIPARQPEPSLTPMPMPIPMPYVVPSMIPMPMYGMPHPNGAMGMVPVNNGHHHHHGYDTNQHLHQFGGFGEQRSKDWAYGSNFGTPALAYPHDVSPNDK